MWWLMGDESLRDTISRLLVERVNGWRWLPNTPGRSIAPGAPETNDIHKSFLHTA